MVVLLLSVVYALLQATRGRLVYTYSNLVNTTPWPISANQQELCSIASVIGLTKPNGITHEQLSQPSNRQETATVGKVLLSPRHFVYSDGPVNEEGEVSGEKYSKAVGVKYDTNSKKLNEAKKSQGYEGYDNQLTRSKDRTLKQGHIGRYKDRKGRRKKKKLTGSNYKGHKRAEKGHKAAKFRDSGGHKKGHHTKGKHEIHKKNEYLKKHEFYDEHHEGDELEKYSGYHGQHLKKNGNIKKKGHNQFDF